MIELADIILVLKYMIATAVLTAIIMAPAYLAQQTKKGKQDMILVRLGSWLFLWSGIGWLIALYWSSKK